MYVWLHVLFCFCPFCLQTRVWISQCCQRHYAWMHTCNYLSVSVPGVQCVRAKQIMCFFLSELWTAHWRQGNCLPELLCNDWENRSFTQFFFCDDLRAEKLDLKRTVCLVCSEFKFEQVFRVEVWFLEKSLSLNLYFEILNFKGNIHPSVI